MSRYSLLEWPQLEVWFGAAVTVVPGVMIDGAIEGPGAAVSRKLGSTSWSD